MNTDLNRRILTLLLVFLVLGIYYPVLFAPLSSVDDPGMYNYLLNMDVCSLRDIFFPGGTGTYYRPLLALSFLLDKYAWGLEVSFMHLQNILWHLANTLLVFAIACRAGRLLKITTAIPAFLAAFFFAVHPVNTESVAWISGRTDLLAGFFILLSVFLLLGRSRWSISTLCAALSLLLACLAKETAVFFFPAALLIPFFVPMEGTEESSLLQRLKKNIPHFLLLTIAATGYFIFRALAFSKADAGMKQFATHLAGGQGYGPLMSLKMVLKAAGFYVKKLFIPFPLNFGIINVSDLYIILGVLLVVAAIWLLIRRTLPRFFFVAALCIGASALMVPLLKVTWTPLAERYMYIPSAFFLIGLTYVVYQRAASRDYRKILVPVIVLIATVAIVGTVQRNILWQDNLAFFQDTLRKSPEFVPAQNEIANAYLALGKTDKACTIIKSMEVPKDINNYQYGLITKSAGLANEGDIEGARNILRKVLENPGRHEANVLLRLLKFNDKEILDGKADRGKYYAENVRLLTRLYAITGDPFYQYRLGQAHMFQGERLKARDAFQRVVAQAPDKVYYRQAAIKLLAKMSVN